jgi:hypothetical protein
MWRERRGNGIGMLLAYGIEKGHSGGDHQMKSRVSGSDCKGQSGLSQAANRPGCEVQGDRGGDSLVAHKTGPGEDCKR